VKFTPEGGSVVVSAHYLSEVARPEAVISVRDTGIGISAEDQQRIFQAFEQVDTSYTRHQQGTGLGLSLAQRIVELHSGRLWLESVEGEGSTFSFALPLRAADTIDDSDSPGVAVAPRRKKKTVTPSTIKKEAVTT
jgi:signal transduction histidine kinase